MTRLKAMPQNGAPPVRRGGAMRLGVILDGAGTTAEGWLQRNRKGAHGEHRYSAEEFGLTGEGIRAQFGDYLASFAL